MDEIKEPEQEKKEIIDRILKTSICFRIDIDKAETLIKELTELELFLGSNNLEEMYPVLYPLKDWLQILLDAFYSENKEEYLRLKKERENWEACAIDAVNELLEKRHFEHLKKG